MRKGFLLSLLIILAGIPFSYGQERTVRLEKDWTEMDFHPQIAGYFHGNIPLQKFCDPNGIVTNVGYKILTFDMLYQGPKRDEFVHVIGNLIPDSICIALHREAAGREVYFSNIKSMDRDGKIIHLSPMRLVLVKDEEEGSFR
jgi:hypothetical protein